MRFELENLYINFYENQEMEKNLSNFENSFVKSLQDIEEKSFGLVRIVTNSKSVIDFEIVKLMDSVESPTEISRKSTVSKAQKTITMGNFLCHQLDQQYQPDKPPSI